MIEPNNLRFVSEAVRPIRSFLHIVVDLSESCLSRVSVLGTLIGVNNPSRLLHNLWPILKKHFFSTFKSRVARKCDTIMHTGAARFFICSNTVYYMLAANYNTYTMIMY